MDGPNGVDGDACLVADGSHSGDVEVGAAAVASVVAIGGEEGAVGVCISTSNTFGDDGGVDTCGAPAASNLEPEEDEDVDDEDDDDDDDDDAEERNPTLGSLASTS